MLRGVDVLITVKNHELHITLGRTGLRVSVAGLGTGGFSRLGLRGGKTEDERSEIQEPALRLMG